MEVSLIAPWLPTLRHAWQFPPAPLVIKPSLLALRGGGWGGGIHGGTDLATCVDCPLITFSVAERTHRNQMVYAQGIASLQAKDTLGQQQMSRVHWQGLESPGVGLFVLSLLSHTTHPVSPGLEPLPVCLPSTLVPGRPKSARDGVS